MTLKKMDVDKDGRICQDDFEQTIQEEPLLLEAFGPCLPKEKALDNFMKNILGRQDGTKSIKNFFLGLTQTLLKGLNHGNKLWLKLCQAQV